MGRKVKDPDVAKNHICPFRWISKQGGLILQSPVNLVAVSLSQKTCNIGGTYGSLISVPEKVWPSFGGFFFFFREREREREREHVSGGER